MLTRLVALWVEDPDLYATYRRRMTPLLEHYGGDFGVDVEVERVLRPTGADPFNRIFTISFPSREAHDAFFGDPSYQEIRQACFEPAVRHTTILATYEGGGPG